MSDPPTPSVTSAGSLRLTYAAIAARLGISADAAWQLARCRGWERVHGNHPGAAATIIVPPDELDEERWRVVRPSPPGDRATPDHETGHTPPDTGGVLAGALAALEDAVASLRSQLDASNARADAALVLADRTLAQLAVAAARADRTEAEVARERARANALRQQLLRADARSDELRTERDQAEAEAEAAKIAQSEAEADTAELRQAEAERKARGLLARLRAVVRGE